MIVDTHVHIWEMPPIAPIGPTAPTFKKLPTEPATAEELIADMDQNGVNMSVLVQTSWSTWDNGYLADSAKKYPKRFVTMGMVDPMDKGNAEISRYWMQDRGCVGFRLHPCYYKEPILTLPQNEAMWKTFVKLGAVIQVQLNVEHAPQVAAVAKKYPSVKIVLDHMAYPDTKEYPHFTSHQPIIDLAKHPNVYVKISDLKPQSKMDYPYTDIQGIIRKLHNAYGINRLMWGTGYPGKHRIKHNWPTLDQELRIIREGIDWLSKAEKDRLLGGTAAEVWNLK
ncbi:MAG: amidohydrolase [SAR202 cluster bacterium]|nr:amidohydrolase [SAR202 cluster bacterium]